MGEPVVEVDFGSRRAVRSRRPVRREDFLSKPEIARKYAVTTTTIDTWSRDGLPWHRVGARRKFLLSETDAWMESTGRLG